MKDTMLLNVRVRNGIEGKYTTNDNECMNSKFKRHVNYKASDLPKFIKDVEEFVRLDQTVIESAFAGTGEYKFVEGFTAFNLGSKWWALNPVKRTAHFNRFLEFCKCGSSTQETVAGPIAQNSVEVPTVNIAGDILQGILRKAERLVNDNLVSELKGKENKQVAIASESDVYPRIVVLENRKRRPRKCGGIEMWSWERMPEFLHAWYVLSYSGGCPKLECQE